MVRNAACEVLGREDVGAEEPLMSGVLEHSVQANTTLRPIPALCLSPGSTTEIHQNNVSKEAAQTLHTNILFRIYANFICVYTQPYNDFWPYCTRSVVMCTCIHSWFGLPRLCGAAQLAGS